MAPAVARDVVVELGDLAGEDLRIRTQDVHCEVHGVAVRLGPEHLVRRTEGGDAGVLAPVHGCSQCPIAVDPHDLDLGPLPYQVLTNFGIRDASVVAGALDDRIELLLEATMARGRGRSPL